MPERTPKPFTLVGQQLRGPNSESICLFHDIPPGAYGEFILRACNSHGELLAALDWLLLSLTDDRWRFTRAEAIDKARAVIAKARGQT